MQSDNSNDVLAHPLATVHDPASRPLPLTELSGLSPLDLSSTASPAQPVLRWHHSLPCPAGVASVGAEAGLVDEQPYPGDAPEHVSADKGANTLQAGKVEATRQELLRAVVNASFYPDSQINIAKYRDRLDESIGISTRFAQDSDTWTPRLGEDQDGERCPVMMCKTLAQAGEKNHGDSERLH